MCCLVMAKLLNDSLQHSVNGLHSAKQCMIFHDRIDARPSPARNIAQIGARNVSLGRYSNPLHM